MNRIDNLRDLFIQQGRELYNSSHQQLNELPSIEKQVTSPELKKILIRQINKIQNQQVRLAEALKKINASPDGEKCLITEIILVEAQNSINRTGDSSVRDAGIIVSMQNMIHRKMAGFGTTTSFAHEIGQEQTARTLHEALLEEKEIDNELSQLAEVEINKLAKTTAEAY